MLRESLNEVTKRGVGNKKRHTFKCARDAESSQRPYDSKGIMGHQNCRLEDGVILLWVPKCEEGTAGCEDLLNLLVAGEVTNDRLIDGGGGLDRQGVHEHRRSGRHVEGSQRSLFVNGRFVRSYVADALSFRLAAEIRPPSTATFSISKTYHD